MIQRKKLPAFGAGLRTLRRRGTHPACVHLIYGYKWRASPSCGVYQDIIPGVHPELAIKPDDYAPDVYDFSVVVGLQVCVFDQVADATAHEDPVFGPYRPERFRFWWLIRELAVFAADVVIHDAPGPLFTSWSAFRLAEWRRRHYRVAGVLENEGWPSWWSAEIEEANARRRDKWCRVVLNPERSWPACAAA